jgi:hypothetical protein
MGYPTGKQTRASTGMGKNLNPHADMGFFTGKVRVDGCGYATALLVSTRWRLYLQC